MVARAAAPDARTSSSVFLASPTPPPGPRGFLFHGALPLRGSSFGLTGAYRSLCSTSVAVVAALCSRLVCSCRRLPEGNHLSLRRMSRKGVPRAESAVCSGGISLSRAESAVTTYPLRCSLWCAEDRNRLRENCLKIGTDCAVAGLAPERPPPLPNARLGRVSPGQPFQARRRMSRKG